ncbi:MAG: pentapeptide repeat-containing protein [Planctomycetia bacterium]|nr:pentapeptide repeat-containing protein [Planctomycetia bacterium]
MRTVIQKQSFVGQQDLFDADSALVLDSTFADRLMHGVILSDAVFVRCEFRSVSLYWAHMFRTVFLECSFTDVEFRGANMEQCMFVRCALTRCDFSRDNLGGVTDLSDVFFTDTQQTNCKYDAA